MTHSSLLDKVRERLGGDVVNLRYREEVGSGAAGSQGGGQVIMAGGARLIGIESDQDLERWIRGGSRLVLVRSLPSTLSLCVRLTNIGCCLPCSTLIDTTSRVLSSPLGSSSSFCTKAERGVFPVLLDDGLNLFKH